MLVGVCNHSRSYDILPHGLLEVMTGNLMQENRRGQEVHYYTVCTIAVCTINLLPQKPFFQVKPF